MKMGIKGLWTILTPYCEKKSLHEIRGEKVAVDLAGWVCDSQNVTDYHVQPRLYLRNLFFRTTYILLGDVLPVFVLEGCAPVLKRDVMAQRNQLQFRGAAPRADGARARKPDGNRRRFKAVLGECECLLASMGVRCVKGRGEAEAMCAHLNAEGLVDAVVTQDSDCFAYGGLRVYRNFSVANAGGGGALQGSIDAYDITTLAMKNGFGRNKMVALALLCGCDYGPGAAGTSITNATDFLHAQTEEGIIDRLISWVTDVEYFESQQRWLNVPGLCTNCGHSGRMASHTRGGCSSCDTRKGCLEGEYKKKRARVKCELGLRERALSSSLPFPDPLVMEEFLLAREEMPPDFCVQWNRPDLIKFVKIMRSKLGWTEKYCVEKFLPLLTRWQLEGREDTQRCNLLLVPAYIKKKRTPRGIPSYEVVWNDPEGHYNGLVPDDQFEECETVDDLWTTVERQDLMAKRYPDVVDRYEESKKKPKKATKSRKKVKENTKGTDDVKPKRQYKKKQKEKVQLESNDVLFDEVNNLSISMSNLNLDKSKNFSCSVKKLKRIQKSVKVKHRRITSLFRDKILKNSLNQLEQQLENMSVCELPEKALTSELDLIQKPMSNDSILIRDVEDSNLSIFTLDDDESFGDLSDIVEQIFQRNTQVIKTITVENTILKLKFDGATSCTPEKKCRNSEFQRSVLKRTYNYCSTPITNAKYNRKNDENEISFTDKYNLKKSNKENRSANIDDINYSSDIAESGQLSRLLQNIEETNVLTPILKPKDKHTHVEYNENNDFEHKSNEAIDILVADRSDVSDKLEVSDEAVVLSDSDSDRTLNYSVDVKELTQIL